MNRPAAHALDGAHMLNIGNAELTLLPQRALLWRQKKLLVLADLHFGKAAAFRAGGVPVPHGTTRANLDAIDGLLASVDIGHILFLGDFLHSRTARAPATLDALQHWRERHADVQLTLVRGNHDRHAGDPPDSLRIAVADEPLVIDGLAFCHHPQTVDDAYVLAGHLHPVFRLQAGRDSLRLPCFLFAERVATLPAFGTFTGGYNVVPASRERMFICADDRVFFYPG